MVKKKLYCIMLTFITSILLFILSILLILDFTILNKRYIKKQLDKVDYYNETYDNINIAINDILNYSGIVDMDLNSIINPIDVKNDINDYFDKVYIGRKPEINLINLETKLNKEINEYIKSHKIKVNNGETISIVIKEISKEYKNRISFYGYIEKYTGKFYKIKVYTISLTIIIIILFVISFTLFLKLHSIYISVPFTMIIILFFLITLFIRENINYENIFIISTEFSKALSTIIKGIITINTIIIIRTIMIDLCIILINLFKRA